MPAILPLLLSDDDDDVFQCPIGLSFVLLWLLVIAMLSVYEVVFLVSSSLVTPLLRPRVAVTPLLRPRVGVVSVVAVDDVAGFCEVVERRRERPRVGVVLFVVDESLSLSPLVGV